MTPEKPSVGFPERILSITFIDCFSAPINGLEYKILHIIEPFPNESEHEQLSSSEETKTIKIYKGKTGENGRELIRAEMPKGRERQASKFLSYIRKRDGSWRYMGSDTFTIEGNMARITRTSGEKVILNYRADGIPSFSCKGGAESCSAKQNEIRLKEGQGLSVRLISHECHRDNALVTSIPKYGLQAKLEGWMDDRGSMIEYRAMNEGIMTWIITPKGCLCDRDLTEEEFKKVFSGASDADIKEGTKIFNKIKNDFEINTCLRMNHFFAQVLEEVSSSFNLSNTEENFNYAAEALILKFRYFKINPEEAWKLGRVKDKHPASPKEIANRIYAGRIGNDKEISIGDGWKYRGRGMIQLTGKENYKNVTELLIKKGFTNSNFLEYPDDVARKPEAAFLSALAFWEINKINKIADKLPDKAKEPKQYAVMVNYVTKIINSGLNPGKPGEDQAAIGRRENFYRIFSIFIQQCKKI